MFFVVLIFVLDLFISKAFHFTPQLIISFLLNPPWIYNRNDNSSVSLISNSSISMAFRITSFASLNLPIAARIFLLYNRTWHIVKLMNNTVDYLSCKFSSSVIEHTVLSRMNNSLWRKWKKLLCSWRNLSCLLLLS